MQKHSPGRDMVQLQVSVFKLELVAHAHNPALGEMEAEDHKLTLILVYIEFEATLAHVSLCLKKTSIFNNINSKIWENRCEGGVGNCR